MVTAYLALGSNLGDRRAFLHAAAAALGQVAGVRVVAESSIYETVPEGNAPEPLYLNAVMRVETSLTARQLLDSCLGIERTLGRVRPADGAKRARVIDIDVLLFGEQTIDELGLQVPHPALLTRPFVRIPLADVATHGLRHPQTGERLDMSRPDPGVRRLSD
ncbi:MAG TPA: 2-amino-4-hydroxy-6-hydroxymethyldihydropteridine diphosphokinase [Polyangia bacterium]|nr:2-amino-4-hydroxy-6-hydroxymethyldihydropteridine diphosphokinase [Polyangia bacterium]